MPSCEKCGKSMLRSRRSLLQKLRYVSLYKCKACGHRQGSRRDYSIRFVTHAHCPHCGNEKLRVRSTIDKIDRLLRTPMSLANRLLNGTLYHCQFCRVQFYDVRKLSQAATTVKPVN